MIGVVVNETDDGSGPIIRQSETVCENHRFGYGGEIRVTHM